MLEERRGEGRRYRVQDDPASVTFEVAFAGVRWRDEVW